MKNNNPTNHGAELQPTNNSLDIVQLEDRLEMVQADSLAALASCCMDSEETTTTK